eukprot:CAMPEP_0183395212 /NCGR_PEP_ID=MMETSP0370-20130417/9146_1 /TAXON_ID=268820 /ORGANISM="Peridinium aciculiferum, Strain PAER-2" /LENGTH=55 /DNA_ID=CAMNT_0025575765 /DNA_START=73 /DNA_END=240 /DNA_ORIENTATION=-
MTWFCLALSSRGRHSQAFGESQNAGRQLPAQWRRGSLAPFCQSADALAEQARTGR